MGEELGVRAGALATTCNAPKAGGYAASTSAMAVVRISAF